MEWSGGSTHVHYIFLFVFQGNVWEGRAVVDQPHNPVPDLLIILTLQARSGGWQN